MRGRLITIEGLDGAGKTTLAAALAEALARARAASSCCASPAASSSPSASARSSRTRRCAVDPRAEALLYAAARAQLVAERVRPLLEAGTWVLLDRFVDSSLAYQGAGRGLGDRGGRRAQPLRHRRPRARPHAAAARRRRDPRRARQDVRGEAPDRLEREDGAFFAAIGGRLRARSRRLSPSASACSTRATAPAAVLAAALAALADLDG